MTTSIVNKLRRLKSKSNHKQHKHSAMVLYKGRPLSSAFNQNKTHPKAREYDENKHLHAEMAAILRVKNQNLLKDSVLLVYREHLDGSTAISKPCVMCEAFIRDSGIRTVFYSVENSAWVEENYV